jgi:L-alanine-DL-glutamate epimerase-like enolase superfamily enzyme
MSPMKITDLRVYPTRLTERYFINIVKIETNEGIFGIGEGSLGGRDHGVLGTYKHLRELILGRNPFQIEDIWQDMYRSTFWRGGPILLSAISGIDTALWDLKGKALGVPVYELLGGKTRDRARVYTHIQGETDDEMCASALSLVDEGYTALRITPSLFNAVPWEPRKSVRATIRTFEKLRRAVGEDIDLMIDVHHRFTPMENVQLGQGLQPYDPFFIEDPIPPDNLQSYELMRAKIDVPLATGEAMVTKWQFKHLIEKELIDYLRMDPIHSGGITETRKIAVMGEVHNINLVLHTPGAPILAAICLQINAATSNFGILESPHCVAPHMAEIFPVHPVVRNGYYDIPTLPGLGLEFDEQAVQHYDARDRIPELPHLRRADGSVTDW